MRYHLRLEWSLGHVETNRPRNLVKDLQEWTSMLATFNNHIQKISKTYTVAKLVKNLSTHKEFMVQKEVLFALARSVVPKIENLV